MSGNRASVKLSRFDPGPEPTVVYGSVGPMVFHSHPVETVGFEFSGEVEGWEVSEEVVNRRPCLTVRLFPKA